MAAVSRRALRVAAQRWLLTRDFAWLWTGQTISAFGSYITSVGFTTLALFALAATPLQLAWLTVLEALPTLTLGLIAGLWIDRLARRPVMLLADIGRATLLLIIPLAAWLHWLDWPLLFTVALLVGALAVGFDLAYQAYVTELLPPEHLVAGNSRIGSSAALAEIGGPAFAGALIQALTAPIAILGDALSFLVSAVCLWRIRKPDARPVRVAEDERHSWRDALAGWRITWEHPTLRALALCTTTRTFCGGAFAALYGLFVLREIRAAPVIYGALIGLGGIGALLGSLVVGRFVRGFGIRRALIVSAFWAGGTALILPLAFGPLALLLLAASQLIGDIAHAIYEIAGTSLRQSVAPPDALGRTLATMRILNSAALPLGALLAGLVSQILGTRLTLGAASIGMSLAALWLLRLPKIGITEAPST